MYGIIRKAMNTNNAAQRRQGKYEYATRCIRTFASLKVDGMAQSNYEVLYTKE